MPSALTVEPTPAADRVAIAGSSAEAAGLDVLVAIPVLNEADHIETCLRSLMTADARIADVLFVVADGGSSDATCAIVERLRAEFPNLRLMKNPKRLQSAAVNLVAKTFSAERKILVRCDAHSVYPSNYVMKVADSLTHRAVASLATPMDATGESCFGRANAFIVDTPFGSGGSAHRGGRRSQFVEHGHHSGFDLGAFLSVGGYDEAFSHNEDAEFDRRLTKAGGRIFLDADIRIAYTVRSSVGALARQYFAYGKGRARTLIKHRDAPRLRQLIPQAAFLGCVAGLAIAPFAPIGLAIPGTYLAVLALVSLAGAFRMKSPCGLLTGLASATMHMSWAAGFFRQLIAPATWRGRAKPSGSGAAVS